MMRRREVRLPAKRELDLGVCQREVVQYRYKATGYVTPPIVGRRVGRERERERERVLLGVGTFFDKSIGP